MATRTSPSSSSPAPSTRPATCSPRSTPTTSDRPTPCGDWTVRELADHLAAAPEHFLQQARGEEVDWRPRPEVGRRRLGRATSAPTADDLIHHWHGQPATRLAQADWQTAEVAVHTWDLVQALGRSQASTTRWPSAGWPSCSRG